MVYYIYFNSIFNFIGLSTTEPENRFVCPRCCGRSYKWKTNLIVHLKNECGINPKFKCPYCSKLSHHKSNLKRHILCVHNVLYNEALIICSTDNN